jgi:hypothetical protein
MQVLEAEGRFRAEPFHAAPIAPFLASSPSKSAQSTPSKTAPVLHTPRKLELALSGLILSEQDDLFVLLQQIRAEVAHAAKLADGMVRIKNLRSGGHNTTLVDLELLSEVRVAQTLLDQFNDQESELRRGARTWNIQGLRQVHNAPPLPLSTGTDEMNGAHQVSENQLQHDDADAKIRLPGSSSSQEKQLGRLENQARHDLESTNQQRGTLHSQSPGHSSDDLNAANQPAMQSNGLEVLCKNSHVTNDSGILEETQKVKKSDGCVQTEPLESSDAYRGTQFQYENHAHREQHAARQREAGAAQPGDMLLPHASQQLGQRDFAPDMARHNIIQTELQLRNLIRQDHVKHDLSESPMSSRAPSQDSEIPEHHARAPAEQPHRSAEQSGQHHALSPGAQRPPSLVMLPSEGLHDALLQQQRKQFTKEQDDLLQEAVHLAEALDDKDRTIEEKKAVIARQSEELRRLNDALVEAIRLQEATAIREHELMIQLKSAREHENMLESTEFALDRVREERNRAKEAWEREREDKDKIVADMERLQDERDLAIAERGKEKDLRDKDNEAWQLDQQEKERCREELRMVQEQLADARREVVTRRIEMERFRSVSSSPYVGCECVYA